jgi:hypothetical protein
MADHAERLASCNKKRGGSFSSILGGHHAIEGHPELAMVVVRSNRAHRCCSDASCPMTSMVVHLLGRRFSHL